MLVRVGSEVKVSCWNYRGSESCHVEVVEVVGVSSS